MKNLLLFEFLVLNFAAVISPSVFLNNSEFVNAVATQPIVGTPDLRFGIELQFDGPKLEAIVCMLNTVHSLLMLGFRDFLGSMGKASWAFPDHRQVGVVITPSEQGGRIPLRFVIWGLSQGAARMIQMGHFQAVTFALLCTCSLLPACPNPTQFEAIGIFSVEQGVEQFAVPYPDRQLVFRLRT